MVYISYSSEITLPFLLENWTNLRLNPGIFFQTFFNIAQQFIKLLTFQIHFVGACVCMNQFCFLQLLRGSFLYVLSLATMFGFFPRLPQWMHKIKYRYRQHGNYYSQYTLLSWTNEIAYKHASVIMFSCKFSWQTGQNNIQLWSQTTHEKVCSFYY